MGRQTRLQTCERSGCFNSRARPGRRMMLRPPNNLVYNTTVMILRTTLSLGSVVRVNVSRTQLPDTTGKKGFDHGS
jgi:hypothetical protein